MQKTAKRVALLVSFLAALLVFFMGTFHFDNKYTTPTLPSQDGVLTVTDAAFEADRPIFLMDQWRLADGVVPPDQWDEGHSRRTYIGEFANFRRGKPERAPLGSGTYQLRLRYDGQGRVMALRFPELFTRYTLWWDDAPLQTGSGTAVTALWLTPGEHRLTVAVTASHGYYAGMYYPGVIGSETTLLRVEHIQSAVYGLALLAPLVLAAFCLSLWRRTGNRLRRSFALLCLSFSVYMSHYFVQLWQLPFSAYWYPVEDASLYALLYFAVLLSLEVCGLAEKKFGKHLRYVALVLPAMEIALYLLTGVWKDAARLHGMLQDGYRVCIFVSLLVLSLHMRKQENREARLILCANAALGTGLLLNLLTSNLFEPNYTLWQFEWCATLMVGLFAAVLVRQNQRILEENEAYQTQLESMVRQRTEHLNCVLEERRAFFSDIAHNLKAPLHATNTFIRMVRRHAVGLDEELQFHLDQVEIKQEDMARRIQSLNDLTEADRPTAAPERLDVATLLQEIYLTHNPEAVASGIHLVVPPPEQTMAVVAQREKLLLAFENIIYNALRFTPMDGCIVVSAEPSGSQVRFTIADTGCGIAAEDLPHVFDRFYKGAAERSSGSGLGLYIVKTIVDEAGGTVAVEATVGKGATFEIRLPDVLK